MTTERNPLMMHPTEFKRMVLKALHQKIITGDEAKMVIREGQKERGIFLFEDDMTEADYLLKSGMEKLGFFGGIILDGTGEDFLEVKDST